MNSHPDADAFVRAILCDPADETARLVFADWLEETDEPSNVAWAEYIRLKAEASQHPSGSSERYDLDWRAVPQATRLRAHLQIPASLFVTHHSALKQLLPLKHFTVRLKGFTPNPCTTHLVVEQLAQLYPMLPLGLTGSALLVALPRQNLIEPYLSDLSNLLGIAVTGVAGELEEIEEATRRIYPIRPPAFVTVALR